MSITDRIPWLSRVTTVCGIPVSPDEVFIAVIVGIAAAAVILIALRPGLSVAVRLLGGGA